VPQTGQTSPEFNTTVDIIRSEHLAAARSSVTDPFLLEELEAEIEKDCDWLRGFLFAAQVSAIYCHSIVWIFLNMTSFIRSLVKFRRDRRIALSGWGRSYRVKS
jgi:hypothetical protein